MTARRRLARLDDVWLRRSARGLGRLRRRWAAPPGPVRASVRAAFVTEPALAASIVAVVVAALLLGVAGGDRAESGGPTLHPVLQLPNPQATGSGAALGASIGPRPGEAVATYYVDAAFRLRRVGEIAADRAAYAVVDLRHYVTPARAAVLFDGAAVVQAYVRVPSRLPTQVHLLALRSTDDIAPKLATAARAARHDERSDRRLVRSFRPTTAAQRHERDHYRRLVRSLAVEVAALRRPARCRCVFAVLVHADIARLASLARIPEVRVVDPASPLIPLGQLSIQPLEPQVRTTVPPTPIFPD